MSSGFSPLDASEGEPVNWRRATQISLGLVVLVSALLGLMVSTSMTPASGVVPENPGGVIRSVEPGSPAWRDGIREGDSVVALDSAEGTWSLMARKPDGVIWTSAKLDQIQDLRSTIPFALVGLILAAIAALLIQRGQPAAAVLLPIAILFAAQPLFYAGSLTASIGAGVVLFAGSALAAVVFGRWRPVLAIPLAVGVLFAVAWAVSIVAVPQAFDVADASRVPMAIGFGVIGFATVADRRRILDFMTRQSAPAAADLLYLGSAVTLVLAGLMGIVDLIPAILVAVVAVLAYPFWRRASVSAFERLIASQARRDASIRAVEEERGRLAREIHDSPLQELSGVIRRLETLPGAEHEADALRAVAGQLRDVATSLHPPVLVDLGLAASIEDLRDQLCAATPNWQINVDVDDLTTAGRPPADVELAAFRITQESMTNAIAHSGGRCLEVRGSVAPEVIDLAIRDDGHGLRENEARAARRSGHFGLDSIRERAIAAGGTSVLTSSPDGVCVRFRWESRA
jgi:signal transduction histidine kinase